MSIENTDNSYEYKLRAAGVPEPLSTYLSDPLDVERAAAGFVTPVKNAAGTTVALSAGPIFSLNPNPTLTSPYKLRKVQAALARVRSNTGNMIVACVGDSLTAGVGAQGGTVGAAVWTGAKALSYPTRLAALLNSSGLVASIDNVTSDNSTVQHSGTVPGFDTRVTLGANWTISAINTAGGQMIGSNVGSLGAAAAETMTFTPANAFTEVDIYWYRSPAVGTFTADIGSGVLATMAAGTAGLQKTTITGMSNTTHTLNLIRTVVGNVFIIGIVCRQTAVKSVSVLNLGWSGARTSTWVANSTLYDPLPALGFYAPDLTVIMLGTNDFGNAVSGASTIASLTLLVNQARVSGDALIVIPPATITSFASVAAQAETVAAIQQVAATLGVPVIDMNSRWESYAISNALGFYNTDGIHYLNPGYQDVASTIASFILSN